MSSGADPAVLARRPDPEHGFRTCLGILRLFRGLTADRTEAVSLRVLEIRVLSYGPVAWILRHRLDQTASPRTADGIAAPMVGGMVSSTVLTLLVSPAFMPWSRVGVCPAGRRSR
jgi:hypothetical protein